MFYPYPFPTPARTVFTGATETELAPTFPRVCREHSHEKQAAGKRLGILLENTDNI